MVSLPIAERVEPDLTGTLPIKSIPWLYGIWKLEKKLIDTKEKQDRPVEIFVTYQPTDFEISHWS